MSREIWKKVFSTIQDEDLVYLIDIWSLKVKGFRQITKDNVRTGRSMAITEALKPTNLKLIKSFYDLATNVKLNDSENDIADIRGEDVESLLQHYKDGLDLHMILGVLYSSTEKQHHERAIEFENLLLKEYNVTSLDELKPPQEAEGKEEEYSQMDLFSAKEAMDWENKLNKSEAKNKELRKTIESWEKQFSDLKKQQKQEKQQWVKEKAQLRQEIGMGKSSHTDSHKELTSAKEEADKLKKEVQRLKSEISHLNALILNSNTEVALTKTEDHTKDSPLNPKGKPLHIALVGDPKNKLTDESKDPVFHVFSQEDLKEALEKEVFGDFDGVWIMSYLISPQIKKKIKKQHTNNVREFTDFPTMKRYITKGR